MALYFCFLNDNKCYLYLFVLEAGTAIITVTNGADNDIVATYRVIVEDVGYNVTNATLKNVAAPTYATTLTYKDFVTYTAAEADPVVSGDDGTVLFKVIDNQGNLLSQLKLIFNYYLIIKSAKEI